jgi:hypothetical protein
MNILAFILVVIGGALGVAILVQTGIKSLVGWALVAISVGVIIQEVFIHWSHSVHS